ncbi:MAG: hypothetical protein ACKOYN_06115 [Planctomycetota bacterium]
MSDESRSIPLAPRLRDVVETLNTPLRFAQDWARFPISERRQRLRLEAQMASGKPIVVVYSATKSASTAVAAALSSSDALEVVKVHYLDPRHFWPGAGTSMVSPEGLLRHKAIEHRTTREALFAAGGAGSVRPLRIVSIAREPIGFNISNFTYFGRAYWMRTCWRQAPFMEAEELWRRFRAGFPHASSSVWWTEEFSRTIGVDPLAEGAFDAERGWSRWTAGRFDALVLRADLDDAVKTEVLRGFLGADLGPRIAQVGRENLNDRQAPPVLAERLKRAVRMHGDYVDEMLALPAVQRMWSARGREALRARWLGA